MQQVIVQTAKEKQRTPTKILSIFSLPDAVLLINSALRENPNNVQDGDFIKDNYSLELDKLRDLKRNSKKFIENFEQQEQKSINVIAKKNHLKESKIKVAYTRGHGYYIEVKSNVEVPANYSIARTLKDRTRYTTPELLELAKAVRYKYSIIKKAL